MPSATNEKLIRLKVATTTFVFFVEDNNESDDYDDYRKDKH
jgi:hypothetical protein